MRARRAVRASESLSMGLDVLELHERGGVGTGHGGCGTAEDRLDHSVVGRGRAGDALAGTLVRSHRVEIEAGGLVGPVVEKGRYVAFLQRPEVVGGGGRGLGADR